MITINRTNNIDHRIRVNVLGANKMVDITVGPDRILIDPKAAKELGSVLATLSKWGK